MVIGSSADCGFVFTLPEYGQSYVLTFRMDVKKSNLKRPRCQISSRVAHTYRILLIVLLRISILLIKLVGIGHLLTAIIAYLRPFTLTRMDNMIAIRENYRTERISSLSLAWTLCALSSMLPITLPAFCKDCCVEEGSCRASMTTFSVADVRTKYLAVLCVLLICSW